MEQAQVREQIDDLLLAEVPAPGSPVRRQPLRAQGVLVRLRARARREQQHDVARCAVPALDQLGHAACHVPGLAAPPRHTVLAAGALIRDEHLDRWPEDRVGEAGGGLERREVLTELGGEQVVHDLQHLRPGAVVARQGEHAARLGPPLPEDGDVGVAEPVDRLELVADEEEVVTRDEVDQLAL